MRVVAIVAVFLSCAGFLSAEQTFHLEFRDTRVWLTATDAPVRQILAEWARRRGATIVNADALPDSRLTLELTDVHERQALHAVLSDTPNYIVTSAAADSDGSSTFDRILILRTSGTPPPAPQTETAEDEKNRLPDPLELPAALEAVIRAAKDAIPPKPAPAGPESPAPDRR